jgi:hypothetical protein
MAQQAERESVAVARPGALRRLTPRQLTAVQMAMRVFVEDDLARGVPVDRRRHCGACRKERPAAGFIEYGPHAVCNRCATAYEVARLSALVSRIEPFLEDARLRLASYRLIAAAHQPSLAA